MEFDSTVQDRWKTSIHCFIISVLAVALLSLTAAGWSGWNWMIGALFNSFGAFFALFSMAAKEPRRGMACLALGLNLLLPATIVLWFILVSI